MLAALVLATAVAAADLPRWSEGTLEIHQISTGRGNSAFLILPDGTTMLVDAGGAGGKTPLADTDIRPNASRSPGEWIARYIARAMDGKPHIDYAVITHFHADHLAGLPDVAGSIPIGTLIDRGFDYLAPPDDAMMKSYRALTAGRETIRVGRADQIVLRNTPAKYPSFEVRNVAANGDVWTGAGDNAKHVFPPLDSI